MREPLSSAIDRVVTNDDPAHADASRLDDDDDDDDELL